MTRRALLAFTTARVRPPITVRVNAMFDAGAHGNKGLTDAERATFWRYQTQAQREFAASGIRFEFRVTEGAFLRTQGYSVIPDKFLARDMINLFVSDFLGYDVDRDRTGGTSIGPRGYDPYFKTFIGLQHATERTLPHEYAHHLTLDTATNPALGHNFWADLRNDYWLWRQRQGAAIDEFRRCAKSPWAATILQTRLPRAASIGI